MISALIAGLLLGLLGLPLSWGGLGYLWPWFFLQAFDRSPIHKRKIFLFCLGLGHTQLSWLFPVLQLGEQRSLFTSGLIFELAVLAVYLPLGLGMAGAHLVLKSWPGLGKVNLFWMIFPPVYLLFLITSDYVPFAGITLPSIASRPWVMEVFGGSYRFIGTKGVEIAFLFVCLSLGWAALHPKPRLPKTLLFSSVLILGLWGLNGASPSEPEGAELKIAYLPWAGSLGSHPSREQVFKNMIPRTKKAADLPVELVVWPESALPGFGEQARAIETLANTLGPNQSLIVGSNRQELAGDHFAEYNAAYRLEGHPFSFEVYKKQYLVPFAEANPTWAAALPLLMHRSTPYQAGAPGFFGFNQFNLAPGICFEQYLDRWYREREPTADGYIFLSSEFVFPWFAKQMLADLGRAKSLQTDKPVLKVANGALSGLISPPSATQSLGVWHSKTMTGEITLVGNSSQSPFFRFGLWVVVPLSWAIAGMLAFLSRPKSGAAQAKNQSKTP